MKTIALILFQLLITGAVSAATADESETDSLTDILSHGEELHQSHCLKCHTDEVYKRNNRFVKSLEALSKQVVRCRDNTGTPWFDEDTEAVVKFLDNRYYKF